MKLIIHRGTQHIGGSCVELSKERTRIIFDIGQMLPSIEDGTHVIKTEPPIIEGLYKDDKKSVDAIFVSHGHWDHIGLIEEVHPSIPIFIGEQALNIVNMTARFTGGQSIINPANLLVSGKEIKMGDIWITPYLVDHSGFDAYAFIIKADGKCIVYTGDFRDHGRKKLATNYFTSHIPKGIDALLVEGTMMSRLGERIETENWIEDQAYHFMKRRNTPIFVVQSSTNIDRLVGMYKAAKKSGRIFVIDIFTAHILSQLGSSIPKPGQFHDIRVFYPFNLTKRMFNRRDGESLLKRFSHHLISRKELGERNDYCMIIRGSMHSDLQHIRNLQNAGVIYSMWRGYKKDNQMKSLLKDMKQREMEIIDLHTSGHASVKTIKSIIQRSEPKKLIPIHTEKPGQFSEEYKDTYLAKDGEVIRI